MKFIKMFILLGLLLAITFGLVVPAVWLYTANNLPTSVDSAQDIEIALRTTIESERGGVETKKPIKERQPTEFKQPDFARIPKRVVDFYVAETGCPGFLASPKEEGKAWLKRIGLSLIDKQLDGDGACELIMARRVARQLGAKSSFQLAVAADRVHQFLSRQELVAYDLESTDHARGVIGVEAVSKRLLGKASAELTVAENAELQLAMPPDGFYEEVDRCKNASLIKQGRDKILKYMADAQVIGADAALSATNQPVRCLQVRKF